MRFTILRAGDVLAEAVAIAFLLPAAARISIAENFMEFALTPASETIDRKTSDPQRLGRGKNMLTRHPKAKIVKWFKPDVYGSRILTLCGQAENDTLDYRGIEPRRCGNDYYFDVIDSVKKRYRYSAVHQSNAQTLQCAVTDQGCSDIADSGKKTVTRSINASLIPAGRA